MPGDDITAEGGHGMVARGFRALGLSRDEATCLESWVDLCELPSSDLCPGCDENTARLCLYDGINGCLDPEWVPDPQCR